jgi:hypothetical protein
MSHWGTRYAIVTATPDSDPSLSPAATPLPPAMGCPPPRPRGRPLALTGRSRSQDWLRRTIGQKCVHASSPRPTSSSTSRCSTIEPDAIAIAAVSAPRRLEPPQTAASKCPQERVKSKTPRPWRLLAEFIELVARDRLDAICVLAPATFDQAFNRALREVPAITLIDPAVAGASTVLLW